MKAMLAFLGGVGFQELILVLFFLALTILIFLALRALVLWYWKITAIVENQQKQNELLTKILATLKEVK